MGGNIPGGNFPGGNFPEGVFLIPHKRFTIVAVPCE